MDASIYLDYMATTPVDPEVIAAMQKCMGVEGIFGNPASTNHQHGYAAAKCVHEATEKVAALINADANEIVWTSGATESDNLAIIGAAQFYQRKGKHIITMTTEHKAVLDTCEYMQSIGFEVTYLNPEANGILDLEKLKAAIREDTVLISIMHVNNVTGVIQDITKIGEIAREHGVLFHCDATQGVGKVAIDVKQMPIDLMSFSGHKIYGPKGIGGLYVRRNPRIRLQAQIHGGGHQSGMRSGTLPTHQIVGMGKAYEIAKQRFIEDHQYIKKLRDVLYNKLNTLKGVYVNGDMQHCIPGALNIRFDGVTAESLVLCLPELSFSLSSACNSASNQPSYVLSAMGLSTIEARSAIRLSIGRFTTEKDIDIAAQKLIEQVNKLRDISAIQQ